MTTRILQITPDDLKPGDEIKTEDGFIQTGGTQPLSGGRVGIYTPAGLLPVPDDALITIRREVTP